MKKLLVLLAAFTAMLVAVVPAGAVKFGTPDVNNDYPWVGLMVAIDEDGEHFGAAPGRCCPRTSS